MSEQNKRAVESMCRCGLDLEGVINVFPGIPGEEIEAIYRSVRGMDADINVKSGMSINCS